MGRHSSLAVRVSHKVKIGISYPLHIVHAVKHRSNGLASSLTVMRENVDGCAFLVKLNDNSDKSADTEILSIQSVRQDMVSILAIIHLVEVIASKHTNNAPAHETKFVGEVGSNALIDILHGLLGRIVEIAIHQGLSLRG